MTNHLAKGSDVSPYEALLAGSVSGAVARAITAPLDTVKIRLQLQEAVFKHRESALSTIKGILRHEGVAGFWKGNVPAEIMYVLYGSVQFTTYAVLSNSLATIEESTGRTLAPSVHSLIVGTGTGIASTTVTYPFDLLRTRLAANRDAFMSMSAHARSIIAQQGIRGCFVGMGPAMVAVASTTGVMFWAYDVARNVTTKYNDVPFIEGVCGFFAGAVSKATTFPLDTLRKRIQMARAKPGKYTPALALLGEIVRREGFYGVYRGFGVSLLKTAPTSALSLWMYECTIGWIRHSSNPNTDEHRTK